MDANWDVGSGTTGTGSTTLSMSVSEDDTDITDAGERDDVSMDSYANANWSVASIASSVLGYEYENGRRYHSYKSGAYWGPNDDKHNNHLDLLHHVVRLVLDGELYTAPIQDPKQILDLGTGTGIWAIDMADMFPEAEVTGIDLSPTQPAWVSPNCRFEVDDIDARWVRPENHYSFIYARHLIGAISDWSVFLEEIYDHLEPGGWVELVDVELPWKSDDGTITDNIRAFAEYSRQASELHGKPLSVASNLKSWLELKGYINVQEKVIKVPVGPYERDPKLNTIGRTNLIALLEGFEGICMAHYTRYLGWKRQQVIDFIDAIRQELTSGEVHCYYSLYFVVGQKPSDFDDSSSASGTCAESILTEKMRSQLELCRIDMDET